jgi:hypothetical protein
MSSRNTHRCFTAINVAVFWRGRTRAIVERLLARRVDVNEFSMHHVYRNDNGLACMVDQRGRSPTPSPLDPTAAEC